MTIKYSEKTIRVLADCDFLSDPDEWFYAFVASMPKKHWSRYDLSAVRLGCEAHKALAPETITPKPIEKVLVEKSCSDCLWVNSNGDTVYCGHPGKNANISVFAQDCSKAEWA